MKTQLANIIILISMTFYPTVAQNNTTLKSGNLRLKRSHNSYAKSLPKINTNSLNEISRGGLVCSLCIVVDDQFANAYNLKDATQVIIFMRKIVDRVSWTFRTIDWNEDGQPDNIGFEVISLIRGWNPFITEYSASYDQAKPAMQLLGYFASQNFHHCCLGIGFTNRPFEHNQVGVSFIASDTLLGGVCDFRNPSPPIVSANVALISAKGLRGSQLSEKDLSHVLLHELGHSFGVLKHDMDLEPRCSGYDTSRPIPPDYISDTNDPPLGRFIMWGQDIQGLKSLKPNNLDFSPCSKAAVAKMLYSNSGRGNCLVLGKNESPYCGNGIQEFPEECDCGNEVSCLKDGCCGARGSSDPCLFFKGINPKECRLLNQQHGKKANLRNRTKSSAIQLSPTHFNAIVFLAVLNYIMCVIKQQIN